MIDSSVALLDAYLLLINTGLANPTFIEADNILGSLFDSYTPFYIETLNSFALSDNHTDGSYPQGPLTLKDYPPVPSNH